VNVDAIGLNFFRQPFRPSSNSLGSLSSSESVVKLSDLGYRFYNLEIRSGPNYELKHWSEVLSGSNQQETSTA